MSLTSSDLVKESRPEPEPARSRTELLVPAVRGHSLVSMVTVVTVPDHRRSWSDEEVERVPPH